MADLALSHKNEFVKANLELEHKKLASQTSSYNLFKTANGDSVKKALAAKGLKATGPEMSKMLSAQWKGVSASEKKKFENLANANRTKVFELIAAWRKTLPRAKRSADQDCTCRWCKP